MLFTEEQCELAKSERAWLAKHDPVEFLRHSASDGVSEADPRALAHIGTAGIAEILTTDAGGSQADLAVLSSEHGRAASAVPVAEVALAGWVLELAGLADRLAEHVAGNYMTLTTAAYRERVTGPRIVGASAPFVSVPSADRIVGVITDDDVLYVVPDDGGVTVSPIGTIDLTRPWARAQFDVAVSAVESAPLPPGTAARYRDAAAVHRAFDSVGGAAQLLDRTVEYARQREQFGAVIGSFQAVKHHCASMAVFVAAAEATLAAAVDALAAGDAERRRPADAAIAYAAMASNSVAGLAQQVHGGIGFTWEHDLHLYLRRIKVNGNIDGTVRDRRRALVR
ncbi:MULTISPECIES: acyl-CoA dehydrogenase family protein [Gordonia]|uniref:acyl-CoA dehydrogenase family protein n=1 Tax=Gordonia TaxID=2053 RepID=UPI0013315E7A|nr:MULTISPECIES: acyl-CoA dehydrogenase family protein [Gordonia]KAF0969843.1 hypothetical protein BPODLACK_01532 [Gordonia sp. YY1]MCZ0913045.1 acyl-CoA dehydrogenase family protein [Gordonia amicalis]UPW14523.1 acyl-CoA dehydrogenase [Gordonia amicalis]